MIDWLAAILGVERFIAGFLIVCLMFIGFCLWVLNVSYQSRLWERAQMENPPPHFYFPDNG